MPEPELRAGNRLKAGVAATLHASGILVALARERLRRRAVVLMYHRVLPSDAIATTPSHPAIVVSRSTFQMHTRTLARWFRPLSLDAFQEGLLSRRPFAPGSCLVTFDDGWQDNFDHALPCLEAQQIPAAVFLVSELIGTTERFWQERLTLGLRELGRQAAADESLRRKASSNRWLASMCAGLDAGRPPRRSEVASVVSALKAAELEDVESLLAAVEGWTGLSGTALERDFLNWDEVRRMMVRGVTFGSHGATHRLLTRQTTNVGSEVEVSRRTLTRQLGVSPEAFCYPNGDFDGRVVECVREAGYRVAFSTRQGYVSADDDPYEVRRINMHEDMTCTVPLFLARIAGLW